MLTEQQQQEIHIELSKLKDLTTKRLDAPIHYTALKKMIIKVEALRTIDYLKKLLQTPSTFADNFKTHCRERAAINQGSVLDFTALSHGLTNQLYWQITRIVFKPTCLEELLAVLLPDIQYILRIEIDGLPDELKIASPSRRRELLKQYRHHAPPVITQHVVAHKTSALAIPEHLGHYLLTQNTLVDLEDIAPFTFGTHTQLATQLQKNYPDVAEMLYRHNPTLNELYHDIITFRQGGLTPRDIIHTLVDAFMHGGEHFSQQANALESAQRAYLLFLDYWHHLPKTLQQQLDELTTSKTKSLKSIREDLYKGECVETAANYFEDLLRQPRNAPLLDKKPYLSLEEIAQIQSKYQTIKRLPTYYENDHRYQLPRTYLEEVLGKLSVYSTDALINLFYNFPPAFYDDLIAYVSFRSLSPAAYLTALNSLGTSLAHGFFNDEQMLAIIQGIKNHYRRFGTKITLLEWAANTHQVPIAKAVLSLFYNNPEDTTPLSLLHTNPPAIILLKDKPEALITLLKAIDNKEWAFRLLLQPIDSKEQTLFHHGIPVHTFASVLDYLAEDENKWRLLLHKGNHQKTIIEALIHQPPLLTLVFKTFTQDDYRLKLALSHCSSGYHSIAHAIIASFPSTFITLLTTFESDDNRKTLLLTEINRCTLLHNCLTRPEVFVSVLQTLSSPNHQSQIISRYLTYQAPTLPLLATVEENLRPYCEGDKNLQLVLRSMMDIKKIQLEQAAKRDGKRQFFQSTAFFVEREDDPQPVKRSPIAPSFYKR